LASPAVGPLLGLAGPVGTVSPMAAITPGLATDRAGRTLQDAGNRSQGLPVAMQHGRGVSFGLGGLVVHGGSSLAGVIPSSLPALLPILGRCGCCTYFVNPRLLFTHSSRRHFVARLNSSVRP